MMPAWHERPLEKMIDDPFSYAVILKSGRRFHAESAEIIVHPILGPYLNLRLISDFPYPKCPPHEADEPHHARPYVSVPYHAIECIWDAGH